MLPRVQQAQAEQALGLLESDSAEALLSSKRTGLWQWAQSLPEPEFGRKAAMEALNYPARTVESTIKKLVAMQKLARIGEGRATRYRVVR